MKYLILDACLYIDIYIYINTCVDMDIYVYTGIFLCIIHIGRLIVIIHIYIQVYI
jgi:hypothetical protein